MSGTGEAEVTAAQEGGLGLSPVVDPLFVGSAADRFGGPTLVLRGEEVGPHEDPFVWPHRSDPHEALFEVHDVAEQAAWGGASQSHEVVIATLSKLIDMATAVTRLSMETQRLMAEEVTPREQVRPYRSVLPFGPAAWVFPLVE